MIAIKIFLNYYIFFSRDLKSSENIDHKKNDGSNIFLVTILVSMKIMPINTFTYIQILFLNGCTFVIIILVSNS